MSPPNATPSNDAPEPAQTNGTPAAAAENTLPPPSLESAEVMQIDQLSFYNYEYVTGEVITGWAAGAKQTVIDRGVTARAEEDTVVLASLFQEIIRSILDKRLPPLEAGDAVRQILGEEVVSKEVDQAALSKPSDREFDIRSLFLDNLSILVDEVDATNTDLKSFVLATGIPPALMRFQLDTALVQGLGLVRDTFSRVGIRKQTNLLYRQSNYNLLREESEGYSKLLTELFTTSNNEPPTNDVVEDTFERVKAMVGAFDLDVGRVLDVTLDVFAAVLVKQYRFFVKFLSVSSWWPKVDTYRNDGEYDLHPGLPKWAIPGSAGGPPTDEEREKIMQIHEQRDRRFWERVREVGIRAFFEIGRQPVTEDERRNSVTEMTGQSEVEGETRKWIEQTGTLPPKGNRVAAQLLGFKLRFYSSSARGEAGVLPDNLIYLAALLIKIGFISLRDLYPHLWRPDELMDALKEEKMKEKAEREKAARPGGGINALMLAGALPDDTAPRPREPEARSGTPAKDSEAERAAATKEEEKDSLPEPSDQKVLLLKSLLVIGAIPDALFILSRFPWLMDAYPELPEFIHRIIHHCLSKVYPSALRPLADGNHVREPRQTPNPDQSGVPKGQVRLVDGPPRKVLRWAQLDKEDQNDGIDYRFYWDDWADNIPVCQTVDDLFALCSSLLNVSGYKIGHDPLLLTKLARIGKDSIKADSSERNKTRWRDLCKRLLLPSLSLTKANPGVVNEVFELVCLFSREVRYNMYAEWYFGQTSRQPDIKLAFDLARAETKDTLKRLSKTNVRPMARALAKIAYANPGIVINVAISQIESYENLIEVVVECARYFTDLGYDILTWSLVNSLGQQGRSRVQEGGLLTSRWLNALSTFAGRAFKRYSVMDPTPVLQYVFEELRRNNSTDLIVLEQMISSMAGIVTDTNFNDAQIQAMAGGDLLQSQTMLQLLDKRHESKTTSKRLMKSLTDSKLAGQLLIAIAQERLVCVFRESDSSSELKLLGNIFDEIHRILTQYLDLLRSNFSVAEFDAFVPGLAGLIGEFGIQPEVAFWISRPSLCQRIADADRVSGEVAIASRSQESPAKVTDDDVKMVDDGEALEKEEGALAETEMDVEAEASTASINGQPNSSTVAASTDEPAPWHPVLQGLMTEVETALPPYTWEVVGLPFYTTFWQLSLYDVHIPQKAYEDEIERQKRKVFAIGNDRSDVSVAGTQRKEREKKQITELQERLLEENKRHLKAYGQTRARLQKEKDRWFAGMRGKHDALNIAILEQCFLPRLFLSPLDAVYCFKMLKFLHSSGTPNFRTVGLLDQLFRDQRLTAIIFQCTSKEADSFGRFLNEVLRDLTRWHADRAIYEKEAFGMKKDLPGFAMNVDAEGKPVTLLDYEDFRRLFYKWHRFLAASLKTCLNGGEYMHIRNAISILKAIVHYFPAVNWIGRDMLACVNSLSQNDERDDVKTPAASLIGDLNRREKKWMLPQAFMIVS
jgi:THO complex subunit 2